MEFENIVNVGKEMIPWAAFSAILFTVVGAWAESTQISEIKLGRGRPRNKLQAYFSNRKFEDIE